MGGKRDRRHREGSITRASVEVVPPTRRATTGGTGDGHRIVIVEFSQREGEVIPMSAQKTSTRFEGVLVTIRSEKSFFEVTRAIESSLQRFSIPKLMEYVAHGDRDGLEAYVEEVSTPSKFSIFWEFEQGSVMRLAGIPIESKFYLVGNAVIARGLFRYSGAAGLGAPVRICVSQRDGEETRIDMDQPSAFFSKFPEMRESDVPELLDEEMIKVFEDAAA
jgi:uncharacterized protein (DUF302 family)